MTSTPAFRSFWMAGFESACHINRFGQRLDIAAATQHDRLAADDYQRLRAIGIGVAREGIPWPLIERHGKFDFSRVVRMARAAAAHDIQINWTLCHYGWPDDLDVFSAAFVDRFEKYVREATRVLVAETPGPLVLTVVNEISFLSWAAGEVGGFIHPHARGRGTELKRQLVRATIAGIEAARGVAPDTRFLHVDPLILVLPHRDRPDEEGPARAYTESQFAAWDMICGRAAPELGGRPDYLDIQGVNYYHSNQWELGGDRLRWEDEPRDSRWVPLHELLAMMWRRYGRPLVLAETSHFGAGRPRWILEIADQVAIGLQQGLPIEGVCLYPIIDRPDWEDEDHWHNSGLWDLTKDSAGRLRRELNAPYAAAFEQARQIVARARVLDDELSPR